MPRRRMQPGAARRALAEARLAAREAQVPSAPVERERLVHELHVHQLELEMQNEELRRARQEIDALLHKYTELFEFAPMAYAVLDSVGVVLEANLELSRLLDAPRNRLKGWLLAAHVDPADGRALRDFLKVQLEAGPEQPPASLEV